MIFDPRDITENRERLKMTKREVAQRAGVSEQVVDRLEAGEKVSLGTVVAVQVVLDQAAVEVKAVEKVRSLGYEVRGRDG